MKSVIVLLVLYGQMGGWQRSVSKDEVYPLDCRVTATTPALEYSKHGACDSSEATKPSTKDDVPAIAVIHERVESGLNNFVPLHRMDKPVEYYCADKSRVLITAKDGSKHCFLNKTLGN